MVNLIPEVLGKYNKLLNFTSYSPPVLHINRHARDGCLWLREKEINHDRPTVRPVTFQLLFPQLPILCVVRETNIKGGIKMSVCRNK